MRGIKIEMCGKNLTCQLGELGQFAMNPTFSVAKIFKLINISNESVSKIKKQYLYDYGRISGFYNNPHLFREEHIPIPQMINVRQVFMESKLYDLLEEM